MARLLQVFPWLIDTPRRHQDANSMYEIISQHDPERAGAGALIAYPEYHGSETEMFTGSSEG